MVLEWMQKVDVLEYYNDVSVSSASDEFPLPAVMRCRMYVQKPRGTSRLLVSKRNILLRDRHMCQCASPPRAPVQTSGFSHPQPSLPLADPVPSDSGGKTGWGSCHTCTGIGYSTPGAGGYHRCHNVCVFVRLAVQS